MPKEHDPTEWVDEWPIPELSENDRKRIKAALHRAHAIYLRSDPFRDPYAFIAPMEQAYDEIAKVLFEVGILTHDFLGGPLRVLIIEFALRAKWLIGPVERGKLNQKLIEASPGYWAHPGPWLAFNSQYSNVFGAPLSEWRARLLEREAEGIPEPAQPNPQPTVKMNNRQTFVIPLLQENGWSVLDWANEANVAPATAQDYLLGKTKPYRSTLLKLAKALCVSVQSLPR